MSETIITKRCPTCKKTKHLSGFYKTRATKDGYNSQCKICCGEYQRRDKSRVLQATVRAKYRNSKNGRAVESKYKQTESYRLSMRAAQKRYSQTEKGKAKVARFRKTNKFKAIVKRYYIRHPEQNKAKDAVNHAVVANKMQPIKTLRCSCGKQAQQYHHYLGYDKKHWLDVIPVCIPCHNILHKAIA